MRSKRLLAIILATCLLGACNSQDATVTAATTGGSGPGSNPQLKSADRAAQDATKLTNATVKRSVFFSVIATDFAGTPTQVSGVAFLAAASQTSRAFSFHFDNADLPYDSRVFVPSADGILYASRAGAGESALGLLDPRTRRTTELGNAADSRVSRLVSSGRASWAWVDLDGGAWVAFNDPAQATRLALGDVTASAIGLNTKSRQLLVSGVTTGGPAVLVFTFDDLTAPKLRLSGRSAVESPDGSKIAYVQDGPSGSSKIAVLEQASNTTAFIESRGTVRELQWKGVGALTYRLITADGKQSLHRLELATGTDAALVPLHLAADGIACPAWDGESRFYFGDRRNSKFSIFRATRVGQAWTVELFASPDTEMTGYICPELLSAANEGSGS